MTAEREAMTLEDVRDWHRGCQQAANADARTRAAECHKELADAIDAHLSRTAEPVVPVGLVDALRRQRQIDKDGTECGVSRQAVDEAATILESLTHPPEPARDAKRLDAIDKWTAARRRVEFARSLYGPGVEIGLHEPIKAFAKGNVREAIDAAMAQESGE